MRPFETLDSMVTPDGKIMGRTSWYVRNNRRQFMRIDMPADSEIWSVKVAGKAVKPARDESGQVLVPLVRSQSGGGSPPRSRATATPLPCRSAAAYFSGSDREELGGG